LQYARHAFAKELKSL